jgi:ABC-type lipopolysaccharide export system ATPase subunit
VCGSADQPQQRNLNHNIRWTIYRAKESVYVLLGRALHSPVEALEEIDPKMVRIMTCSPVYAYNLATSGAPTWMTKSYIRDNIIIVDKKYVIFDGYSNGHGIGRKLIEDTHLASKYLSHWNTLQKTARRVKSMKLIDLD